MNRAYQEKARLARNAYARAWRAKNPEKVKAAAERYWRHRAEREAAEQKAQDKEATENEE